MSLTQDPGKGSKIALIFGAKHFHELSSVSSFLLAWKARYSVTAIQQVTKRLREVTALCEVVWLGGGREGFELSCEGFGAQIPVLALGAPRSEEGG